jgi:riboflavin synthase
LIDTQTLTQFLKPVFTGLIATTGTIRLLNQQLAEISCNTNPKQILPDLAIGDSVAVDGVCLTVTEILPLGFIATISPETVRRTILQWTTGTSAVNLEPSLRVGSKLGGHFVTGHIDGIGYLDASVQTATAWEMNFQVPDQRVARYIVPKGSVAVNGISLTVADCNATGSWFKVAVIPHTYAETNLHRLQSGDPVNLEGDVLGKYVEKFLRFSQDQEAQAAVESFEPMLHGMNYAAEEELVSPEFLAEHGYL